MKLGEAIVVICLLVLTAIFIFIKKRYSYWANRGVNFIQPTFPYGNLNNVNKKHLFEVIKEHYFQLKGSGPYGGIYFFINPTALILDLDLVKTVLVKDFQYFHDRGLYSNERDDPLSSHLLSMEGNKWRILRSKLTPTFTSGKMKMMFPTIVATAKELNKCFSKIVQPSPTLTEIRVNDYLARFTIDVIGSCAFGLNCNSLTEPNNEFYRMGRKAFDQTGRIFKRLFIRNFQNVARLFHMRITALETENFYLNIINDTIKYREENKIQRNDFLNLLIQLKNKGKLDDAPVEDGDNLDKLTMNEVAAQAFLFLLAGFETSSTTMTFALYELALHLEVQDRVRSEIKSVLSKHEGEMTYVAMTEMRYLKQVINETLRKHPIGGVLTREVTNDYKVPGTDHMLQKGTSVIISNFGIHYDPDIFPEPEKFDPDRFSLEEVQKRHPFAFLAFGEGPRNCIGLRFGMMQSRVGLAMFLLNYRVTKCSKTQIPLKYAPKSTLLSPDGGVWLNVEKLQV